MENLRLYILMVFLGAALTGCATKVYHGEQNNQNPLNFIGGYYGSAAGFPPPAPGMR
jgi:hypothetical protein